MEIIVLKNRIELEVFAYLSPDVMAYLIKDKSLSEMEELLSDENLEEVTIKNIYGGTNKIYKNLTLLNLEKDYKTKKIKFELTEKATE